MSQVTGKKVAVTPMPTPTGTSGAIIDSFNTQDDKTVNAPSIHIVEDAITTINDKLNNIGNTVSYSNTVQGGSTNTWVDLLTVPNLQNGGIYVVTANVVCNKSLTNTLGVCTLSKNDSNTKYLRMNLESGGGGFLSSIFTIDNANDAIKLKMYDNIDNTASYIACIEICRIK